MAVTSQWAKTRTKLASAFAEPSQVMNSASAIEILDAAGKQIISHYQSAKPTNAQVIFTWVAPVECMFKAGMADCKAVAGTAATAEAAVTFKKNGTTFGTATFAISGTVPTWTGAGTINTGPTSACAQFSAGDVLTIVGPATADATLAAIAFSLTAYV